MSQNWRKKRETTEKQLAGSIYNRVMVPLEEAQQIILQLISDSYNNIENIETVSIDEAGGRLLAEEIVAKEPVPNFDRSPLDGYAIRSTDTIACSDEHPVVLTIIDETPAGHFSEKNVTAGTAIKVFTGAPLPKGADAIIRYEEVGYEKLGQADDKLEKITISRPVKSGQSIAYQGEDIEQGQIVLNKGQRIRAGHVGILTSLGYNSVAVIRQPRVAIFSTGDELIPVEQALSHAKIRASNLYTIAEMIRELGGIPIVLGTAADNLEQVKETFLTALATDADIIISTGGVSSGDYDIVKDAMKAIEAENVFWKVAIRPGAPVAVAKKGKQLIVGLSGNPAGAIVVALLLIAPVIAKLTGAPTPLVKEQAYISTNINRERGLRGFMWGKLQQSDILYAEPLADQHCGIVKSYAFCNCLIEIPGGKVNLLPGDPVTVWRII